MYLKVTAALAIILAASADACATSITDFTGQTVELAVTNVVNGGGGFFVNQTSPASAVIGPGNEFLLNVGASGFPTRELRLDFTADGVVSLIAEQQTPYGNTSFSDFSFDLVFTFPDIEITDITVLGDLVRGDTSASGLDPAVWTFENENDNAFGQVMAFGAGDAPSITPRLDFDAVVPEPTSLALLGLGSLIITRRRRV